LRKDHGAGGAGEVVSKIASLARAHRLAMRAATTCLLALATVATAKDKRHKWRPLANALAAYPAVHARELLKLQRGDLSARVVFAITANGLGNRVHPLLSSFALALVQDAALVVRWTPRGCDRQADLEALAGNCGGEEKEGIEDHFKHPGFNWTVSFALCGFRHRTPTTICVSNLLHPNVYPREGKSRQVPMGTYYQDEHQDVVRRANLSEAPWNTTIVVHTWHRFLREVLCNPGVAESGLFPPDQLEAQRALEEYLLVPTDAIAAAAARGVEAAGGCALGLHLRDKSGQRYNNHTVHEQRPGDIFANFPVQNEAELWPRLRAAMAGRGDEKNGGGLFIAADGHSQGLRARLVDAARRENVKIVEPDWLGSKPPIELVAYTENLILSQCAQLVPTGHPPSTFFAMAAARAVASNPRVRAALACPASRVEASPLSPSGESQPCLFEPSCPDPSVRFSGGHNKFGILHR